jgi:hypothetical protein
VFFWLFLPPRCNNKPQIQKAKPDNFHEERREEQTFEYIVISDGTELCTTVNDAGVRMYVIRLSPLS